MVEAKSVAGCHPALLELVWAEPRVVAGLGGSGIGRVVLLDAVDTRLRRDARLRAELDVAAPEARRTQVRALVRAERDVLQRRLAQFAALETFHHAAYHLAIERAGRSRPDAVRDAASARYAGVYPRMVAAVAAAVLGDALTDDHVRRALRDRRWPAGLPFAPAREGLTDLLDQVRSPRCGEISADEHLEQLDAEDGRPDMGVARALATEIDAPRLIAAREELFGRVTVVIAEYGALRRDVASRTRARACRMLTLLLDGHESLEIQAMLSAEGYEPITANAIDAAWTRAIASYAELPLVLNRKRADFAESVRLVASLECDSQ